jgi:hypothetical protein
MDIYKDGKTMKSSMCKFAADTHTRIAYIQSSLSTSLDNYTLTLYKPLMRTIRLW